MLVLTRKVGESIRIGEDIRVTVLDILDRQIKIGIEAPSHTAVHREEVYWRIKEENLSAATLSLPDLEEMVRLWGGEKGGKRDG